MNEEDIRSLVEAGEGYNIEFKGGIPSSLSEISKEICAFANSEGGIVLIGVDDDNNIIGAKINNRNRSRIQQSFDKITPNPNCKLFTVTTKGKQVGVIKVPSGVNKPYMLSGTAYIRNGTNTERITSVENLARFFQQEQRIYFDEIPCLNFDYNNDFDFEMFSRFRKLANISQDVENNQVVRNLNLTDENGVFKSGAVLFFGSKPESFFNHIGIRCVRFEGTTKRYIYDDKFYTGSLYKQYLNAIEWGRNHLNVSYDIESQGASSRIENLEIPETVFREALINALSHRDYYERGACINFEIYDNRVEISNPGGLVSGISDNEFGNRSLSRNPLIFGLFARMRMVERIGSGIVRMREMMKEMNLSEPKFNLHNFFSITLQRPIDKNEWLNKWKKVMKTNRFEILKILTDEPKLAKKELASRTNLSSTSIDKHLKQLKKLGLIERVGSARGGYWKINYTNPD